MILDYKAYLVDRCRLNSSTGCLEWQRARNKWGYGTLKLKGIPESLAHRAAWVIFNGEVPTGKYVLHKCNNPLCCNVEHLYIGTQFDNMRDVKLQGTKRYTSGTTHHNAVLTPEKVIQIREMLTHKSQWAVAAIFGVSSQAIKRIRNGVTWKHV